jgi:hypothetical protein
MKRIVLVLSLLALTMPALAQRVVYVNASAPAGGNGASWAAAFRSLQDALAASREGDELWIARGTYHADDGQGITRGDTTASFFVRRRRALYGGFRGTETTRAARDLAANVTVLSGDLRSNDTDSLSYSEPSRRDNSLHLIRIDTTATGIILDGLTLTGSRSYVFLVLPEASMTLRNFIVRYSGSIRLTGRLTVENGVFEHNYNHGFNGGGAILGLSGHLVAKNVLFRGNRDYTSTAFSGSGGAIHLSGGRADLVRVTFEDNRTRYEGGAIYSFAAPLRIANARFLGNQARSAGAIFVTRTRLTISNTVFSGNEATLFDGGALVVEEPRNRPTQDSTLIHNTTFFGNRAAGCGGAIHAYRSYRTIIRNSIFFGNAADTGGPDLCRTTFDPANDLIRVGRSAFGTFLPPGTLDEGGNLVADPLFVNATGSDGRIGTIDDDLRLGPGSRARDAGESLWLPNDSLDLDSDGILVEPLPLDLDGHARVQGRALDMGAYEATPAVGTDAGAVLPPGALRVWPSPARGALVVTLAAASPAPVVVVVYDALGREHLRVETTKAQIRLDVSALPPGVYVVRVAEASAPFVVAR